MDLTGFGKKLFDGAYPMANKSDRWEELEALLDNMQNTEETNQILELIKKYNEYEVIKDSWDEISDNIDVIASIIYEIAYQNNHGRSIKQRLETKFSSLYLLTKKKNKTVKRAIINVRGYRAIKSKGLFDIGYYLKNNPDVRLSGDDPIMHYIYYGYKEGRDPSPDFDGNYYCEKYSDLNGLNPLVHYSLYGVGEGRTTVPK